MNSAKTRTNLITLLSIILLYLILLFLKLKGYILTPVFITDLDARTIDLISAERIPEMIKIFMMVTLLGAAKFVLALAGIITICAAVWKRSWFILPLWPVLAGTEVCVFLGKIALLRPRPDTAVYLETSAAFPSGHSAIAFALYGFLVFLLTLRFKKMIPKILLYSSAIILILAVGFSRLYLGVHYLSDVIAGYILGALWLGAGIVITKFILSRRKKVPASAEKYLT